MLKTLGNSMKQTFLSIAIGTFLAVTSTITMAKENFTIVWPFGPVAAHLPYKTMSENANNAQNEFRFIVDFKSGAGGAIAAQFAQQNNNVLLASSSAFYTNATPSANYKVDNFKLIDTLCDLPMVLASVKYKTIADFPKNDPIRIGHNGVGSTTHLLLLALQQKMPNIIAVPYQGSNPAIADLLGGHIDAIIGLPGDAFVQQAAGKMNVVAVSGANSLNGVPTLVSLGFPGTEKLIVQYYLHVKTTEPKIDELSVLLRTSLNQPNVRQIFENNMCTPKSTPVNKLDVTHQQLFKYWQDQVSLIPATN
jgi:tripartite-type tricarboxylate transporter receptor subunit TctC